MPADRPVMRGHLHLQVFDAHGELRGELRGENMVVTVGRNGVMDQLLAAPTIGKPTHMAVGTGATAPALGDAALGTESARVALTSKTRGANVVTFVGDYPAGTGTATLTEAGIFDAASAGNMYARATFTGIGKGASDTLKVTWTLTQT